MQAELAQAISDYLKGREPAGYFQTEIPGLVIGRVEKPTAPNPRFSHPQLCVNIQGAKQTMIEGRVFDYREMQFLVVSVDLPILGRAPGSDNLWLATGHGMLGVSMSAVSGRLRSIG